MEIIQTFGSNWISAEIRVIADEMNSKPTTQPFIWFIFKAPLRKAMQASFTNANLLSVPYIANVSESERDTNWDYLTCNYYRCVIIS